ncbi:monothiol glutaredoxin-S15, mitochondrial-like isoform X1 [Macadamia integrifolia]|uniref:monothiol glutaredoxin-S15, mitochondrial-like isoform X1 n=2 Tax=Macadamia integrifolia TaxID=60698 RepID=UPI001C4E6EB5|nr:monothiol glutaredoxin-S15, mitochondrial-like isoform X1 [Macadamia integrifolia]
MARSLSSLLMKGVAGLPAAHSLRTAVAGSFYHHVMTYSTNVTDDPDTHEDFRPTSKLVGSDLSNNAIVEQDVKENPVMIYMKGVPDMPQCGFSSLAVRVLKTYHVPFGARNILEDSELKTAVKSFSNWPTFPQIFIKGEFVGGSDIILNMHQTGELKEKLKDVTANQESKE